MTGTGFELDAVEGRKTLNWVERPPREVDGNLYLVRVPEETRLEETFSSCGMVWWW